MDPFKLSGTIMIAGLLSAVPSSRVGFVIRLMNFCASLPAPGHCCWILLLNHCAEQISEMKSYAIVSIWRGVNGVAVVGNPV